MHCLSSWVAAVSEGLTSFCTVFSKSSIIFQHEHLNPLSKLIDNQNDDYKIKIDKMVGSKNQRNDNKHVDH